MDRCTIHRIVKPQTRDEIFGNDTRWCAPQSDGQLMTEKQIFSLKPASRLEQVGDEHSEGMQNRNHRSQGCDDSALQCEPRPDRISEATT